MDIIVKNINEYSNEEINLFYKTSKNKRIIDKKNEKSKKQSIIGEMILSELLKKYNKNHNKIEVIYNKNGKPYLKNSDIYFNISHADEYVVCAISKKEIGVDIEKIRETNINTINYFSTEKEKEYILADTEKIYYRLFEIYTLKEAYIKMNGDSLTNIKNITNYDEAHITKKEVDNYIITICEKK